MIPKPSGKALFSYVTSVALDNNPCIWLELYFPLEVRLWSGRLVESDMIDCTPKKTITFSSVIPILLDFDLFRWFVLRPKAIIIILAKGTSFH